MFGRFNGRISEVLATHRFDSMDGLETTLKRYSYLYNDEIPQTGPGQRAPAQAVKDW